MSKNTIKPRLTMPGQVGNDPLGDHVDLEPDRVDKPA